MVAKQELEEIAREMLLEPPVMGEFEDKKGAEEMLDPKIGLDVKGALTKSDVALVKRMLWGPLTPAESRELKHKLSELEAEFVTTESPRRGLIIDRDHLLISKLKGETETGDKIDSGQIINTTV